MDDWVSLWIKLRFFHRSAAERNYPLAIIGLVVKFIKSLFVQNFGWISWIRRVARLKITLTIRNKGSIKQTPCVFAVELHLCAALYSLMQILKMVWLLPTCWRFTASAAEQTWESELNICSQHLKTAPSKPKWLRSLICIVLACRLGPAPGWKGTCSLHRLHSSMHGVFRDWSRKNVLQMSVHVILQKE